MADPRETTGAPEAEAPTSIRERLAAVARRKPKAPRLRNWIWAAAGLAVVAVAVAQWTGLSKNPVEEKIRANVERRREDEERAKEKEREKEREAAASKRLGLDDAVPLPSGLPSAYAASLGSALAVARTGDEAVAGRAIERLPALAESAPEDRRREVRTFLLRRLEPLVRAGVDVPLAEEARRAADEILRADPDADPGRTPSPAPR